MIERNPAHDITVPRDDQGERPIRVITPEEADAILEAAHADDERLGRSLAAPLFTLAFGTGLRSGELLGLTWGDRRARPRRRRSSGSASPLTA